MSGVLRTVAKVASVVVQIEVSRTGVKERVIRMVGDA